jgi:hypothetical protein
MDPVDLARNKRIRQPCLAVNGVLRWPDRRFRYLERRILAGIPSGPISRASGLGGDGSTLNY